MSRKRKKQGSFRPRSRRVQTARCGSPLTAQMSSSWLPRSVQCATSLSRRSHPGSDPSTELAVALLPNDRRPLRHAAEGSSAVGLLSLKRSGCSRCGSNAHRMDLSKPGRAVQEVF